MFILDDIARYLEFADHRDNPLKVPRADPLWTYMPLLQGPVVRTPITDMMGSLVNTQEGPTLCANMEMMMLNCLDQYGYRRGMKMCNGYVQDLNECRSNTIELKRLRVMFEERKKQFMAGKREKFHEESPPIL